MVTLGSLRDRLCRGGPSLRRSRNPLGRKAFDPKADEMDFTIPAGQSATFRYRVVIFSRMATPESIEAAYKTYISEVK